MEDIEYLDEYKDLVLPGIKGDVRPSAGARRRRISSDLSNSSSLDADIFQKLFLDKSVDDDLLNLNEVAGSKSHSRRHFSPSSSDDSNDYLDVLFNRKLSKPKPNKRRESYDSYDSVDDLGQALMRSTQRSTLPKPGTSQARAKKSHSDALYRRSSSSSSTSSARGKLSSRKPKPATTASSGKGAAAAAPSLGAKYKNPGKPNSVNGSSSAGKNKAVTILKAQKTDLKPPKHEPKSDPLNLKEFFEDSDSDSSYTYESDFFDDHDSADEDVEPVIDISTDTSRTTSVADTVTPVVSDDEGQELQREEDQQKERSQASIMSSVYERLQSYLNNLSCAEAPPIYKKQSFARKPRSNEKKPSSSEQVKHANERSAACDKVQEEKVKEREQVREPTKASGSTHSSPGKVAGRSTNSSPGKASTSASRRLFEVDNDLTLETVERMTQDLAEQILEIDVERSVEYQKRSGSKRRSRSRSKISGEPGPDSDLVKSHVRKLTYSSERLDNGCEPLGTQLRRSKSESAFPKRGKKQRKSRAATTEDTVLSSAKEGEVPMPVKRKRGRPPKNKAKNKTLTKAESTESAREPVAKDQEISRETIGVAAVKDKDLLGQQEGPEERELNSELEKAKEFAGFTSQDDISMSTCRQETDLKSAPDRASTLKEDVAQNLEEEPHPKLDTSPESLDTAVDNSEITESVTKPQVVDNKDWLPQPDQTEEDHKEDTTMAIKELEEIENAIETAGEIALTPELADALDASPDVQATPATGNILEESDSQLAEDIKLAEEILAAEVGKGVEVTETAAATVEGDQNPVIDIVKVLEQETITEVVGKSDAPSSSEEHIEVKEQSPTKEKSSAKEPSTVEDQSPAKEQSPAREQSSAQKQSPEKEQSPAKEPSPSKGSSPEKKLSLTAEQSPKKMQLIPVEVQGQSAGEEQSQAEEKSTGENKSPPDEVEAPIKEPLTCTEDPPRLDTPTKKRNYSSPAKSKELEAAESSVARRALRSDKSESKPGTPETTPLEQRKSRGKLPLKSDLAVLMDDLSRRSSPRLGRSPAESHSSQERSPVAKKVGRLKLADERHITETKSSTDEIEPKDKNMEEANIPVKDVPVAETTKLAEEKPSSDEIDVEKAKLKPFKKRGRWKTKTEAKATETLPQSSKFIEEQSTSSHEPVKTDVTSESPGEQAKTCEPQVGISDTEKIEEKPSSPRKSRSRRSRKDKAKSESESHTKSSEVEKEKNPSRSSSRGIDVKPETSVDKSGSIKEKTISTRVRRGGKGKSQKRGKASSKEEKDKTEKDKTEKDKMEENERNDKSTTETVTLEINQRDKSVKDKRAGDSSDQIEMEPEQGLTQGRSKKMNPESKAVSTSTDADPKAKKVSKGFKRTLKKTFKNRRSRGDKSKENINTETKPEVDDENVDVEVDVETISAEPLPGIETDSAEDLTESSSKVEPAELIDSPGMSGVGRGRIKKRRQAVSIEDSVYDQIDTPTNSLYSEAVPLPPIHDAADLTASITEIQMKEGKRNKAPTPKCDAILETDPIRPSSTVEESEMEVVAKKKTKKKKRTSTTPISAPDTTADSKESVSTPKSSEATTESSETMPDVDSSSNQKDAKNTSCNSPSKFQTNVPEEVKNVDPLLAKIEPKTPSTTSSCRKLRVLLKRTPVSNVKSKGKTVGVVRSSTKRKKFKKILDSIDETLISGLVDTSNTPKPESKNVCESDPVLATVSVSKSDNISNPVEEEVLKEAALKATDEIQEEDLKEAAKKTSDEIQEEVHKKTAEGATNIQEKAHDKLETINQEQKADKPEEIVSEKSTDNATSEEDNTVQDPESEMPNPLGNDELSKEEATTKETDKEEETHKGDESPKENATEEEFEPSAEPLKEGGTDPDSSAKEIPTEEHEGSTMDVRESISSPFPDPTETETTGVTVVAPEPSTSSWVKRSMRKREADSSQPDAAARRKLHIGLKSAIGKKQDLIKNARRRRQQEDEERPALKRTKTDSLAPKVRELTKFISMIGNETIMTTPLKGTKSEQPQTSQAAKRAAASKGPHYTEITKHVIIPAPGKKTLDEKPTGSSFKKPMVQTLLSSSLNLRKPLPGESFSPPGQGRKSLTKADVDANKAQSLPNLNSSLVLTKKALLSPSKKIESHAKEDVSAATAPRKVNISVSVVPSKDTVADTSPLTKSLEKSPVLPRKVQLVEAQKIARKSDSKKKVEPKVAGVEIPTASPLDKSKPKVFSKSAVATDTPAKKTDSPAVPARKSLQVEVPKKAVFRKSEGHALNSRKAVSKKIEVRKSEGAASLALNARKVILPQSVAKETEPRKSEEATKAVESSDTGATEEIVTVPKGRETAKKAITDQWKEAGVTASMEKPTVAVTPRTVDLAKTVHMTRAASSSRSLAPTPTPVSDVGERQRNASKERLLPPSGQAEAPQELQPSGQRRKNAKGRFTRFKRITPAQKRKALEAADASNPKRPKELPTEERKQEQEEPAQESRSVAFPVKIIAAGLVQQVDPISPSLKAPLVVQTPNLPKPPIPEEKHRKLRIKINRRVFSQWLKDYQIKKLASPRMLLASSEDMASDTESAAESMPESLNSSRLEPGAIVLPPVPPLAPIPVPMLPPVQPTAATSLPAPVPVPEPSDPIPLPASITTPVRAPEALQTAAVRPLAAEKGPDEARLLEEARKLATLRKVQMNTTLPMPLPVPITVAEVKSEPEDAPPEPMEGGFQEALPLQEAPSPAPQAPLVAEGTPGGVSSRPVISVISTPADRRVSNDIPSASAPGSNANSFGHTKMFSFLYPNRHSGKYGEVGLDFCCPNLDGPMAAIDPTRLHAKVEAPVLEMPQYLVITTKFISKADKNIPNKVRAKLELLGKDKELNSGERQSVSATASAPGLGVLPAPAAIGAPVPISQSQPSSPLVQPIMPLSAAPPISAPSSAPTPAVPAALIDSLTKQLPRGTTLTKKVLPPGSAIPPTASDSMVSSLPLSLIQLPTLCPTDHQRMELQTRVQVFDLVLQALSRRAATLTVAERQRTIEEIVKTSTLMPIDVDVGTKLLENYVHYLNKATSTAPVVAQIPPTVPSSPVLSQNIVSTATPQEDSLVTKKPVYDSYKNIIGYKCSSASSLKAVGSTPRRKATPAPAATSTPLAPVASTSSAAVATNAESRFVELDRKTVEANERQFIDLQTTIPLKPPGPKSAARRTVIAVKTGSKTKTMDLPVKTAAKQGKAASSATRVSASRGPASRTPATRGPPVKQRAPPGSTRSVSSETTAGPSLSRTANPNVFIINQASHAEESILPDSNHVVAPMEAEIKGELEDSSEAII